MSEETASHSTKPGKSAGQVAGYRYARFTLMPGMEKSGTAEFRTRKRVHGTWDQRVSMQMSQQLFDRAPQPKFLKLIEGGEHRNNNSIAWLEYCAAPGAFVQNMRVDG